MMGSPRPHLAAAHLATSPGARPALPTERALLSRGGGPATRVTCKAGTHSIRNAQPLPLRAVCPWGLGWGVLIRPELDPGEEWAQGPGAWFPQQRPEAAWVPSSQDHGLSGLRGARRATHHLCSLSLKAPALVPPGAPRCAASGAAWESQPFPSQQQVHKLPSPI